MNNTINTLLKGKWYIDSGEVNPLLALLANNLNGNSVGKSSPYVHYLSMETGIIAGAQLPTDNKEEYTALIPIKGTIYKFNQFCGPMGTRGYRDLLSHYAKDVNCKGIVLDIDSGGGQVYGTPEFYDYIKNYSKPIVAYTDGYLCSAAYYIASACNYIVANKRADAIGSIGVMMYYVDMKGVLEKQGAKVIEEYASKSPEKNGSFKKLLSGTEEGINEYIKEELDPLAETFIEDMKAVRTISVEAFKGETYNATKSLELGLIDQVGELSDAFDKIESLSSNKSKKSKTNMSNKIETPQIKELLGEAFATASTENGILLNETLAKSINTALQKGNEAVETLATVKQNLTIAEETLATEKASAEKISTAIKTALTISEVEGAEKFSNVEGVAKLSELVSEYGSLSGKTTTSISTTDEPDANTNFISGMDVTGAMNN